MQVFEIAVYFTEHVTQTNSYEKGEPRQLHLFLNFGHPHQVVAKTLLQCGSLLVVNVELCYLFCQYRVLPSTGNVLQLQERFI